MVNEIFACFIAPYIVVICVAAGDVAIALTDERGLDVPVTTTDNKDNTFRIEYEPKTVGQYTASVFFADQEIPSSPYKIVIQPSIDVSKVKVQGLEPSKSCVLFIQTLADCKLFLFFFFTHFTF